MGRLPFMLRQREVGYRVPHSKEGLVIPPALQTLARNVGAALLLHLALEVSTRPWSDSSIERLKFKLHSQS
jgi:hypothetical protein